MTDSKVDRPVTDLLATTADGRDITRGFVDALDYLRPTDKTLLHRCKGDLEVYLELLGDDQIGPVFDQRRLSIIAREWTVEPASEDAADIEAADFIRAELAALPFDDISRQMLGAILTGFSVAECVWAMDERRVTLADLRVRDPRRFRFSPTGELLLLTAKNPRGERMPDRKFWTLTMGAECADDPYGRGLGSRLYWPAFFKRHALKFWLSFLDKFGSPTVKVTVPSGTSEADLTRLQDFARGIQRDTGVVVPEGVLVEYLESARASEGSFNAFLERLDRAISKIVLLQTMTTDDGSSLAQSRTHLDVRDQCLKADADLLCESLNRSVVTWLCEWNFPAARPPKVWRRFEVGRDLSAMAARDLQLFQAGYQRTPESVAEVYGEGYERIEAPQLATDNSAVSFSEPDPAEADRIANRLGDESSDLLSGLMVKVREAIDGASSLDEARARLESLSADLDASPDLVALIQQALVAAELRGRFEVADDLGLTRGA